MSAFRDTLPGDNTRALYDAAMDRLGAHFAVGHQDLMQRYAEGGALGVARAAFVPGGRPVEELAEGWEQYVQRSLKQARTAA